MSIVADVNHLTTHLLCIHSGFKLKPPGQEDFTIIQYNVDDQYTPHCDGMFLCVSESVFMVCACVRICVSYVCVWECVCVWGSVRGCCIFRYGHESKNSSLL